MAGFIFVMLLNEWTLCDVCACFVKPFFTLANSGVIVSVKKQFNVGIEHI